MRPFLASFLAVSLLTLAVRAHAQEPGVETAAPPPVAPSEQPTEMNSVPLFATGTALAGVGTASIVAGAVVWADDPCTGDAADGGKGCGMGFGRVLGLFMMGGGGLLALAGAPMIVAGAWQVPADDQGVPPTTATLGLGAGHARLDLTF